MVKGSGIIQTKKLSNHSARKYLVQKLNDNNVQANHIMQISGHKNISSINNYSHINEIQHREISKILYAPHDTALANSDTLCFPNYTAYPQNNTPSLTSHSQKLNSTNPLQI
jgi:hypothetical protein